MLGAVLCSLVILLFLGEWRMTAIAVLTIPISVLAALVGLYATGNTINVMTLAGPVAGDRPAGRQRDHLPGEHAPAPRPGRLARGGGLPRGERGGHARAGRDPLHAPGARPAGPDARPGRVPVPADGPGRRVRHDRPPTSCRGRSSRPAAPRWLRPHAATAGRVARRATTSTAASTRPRPRGAACSAGAFARWEALIDAGIARLRPRCSTVALRHRLAGRRSAPCCLLAAVARPARAAAPPRVLPRGRRRRLRDLRPRRRAAPGSRRPRSRSREVEEFVRETIGDDLQLIISELGVVADWSAAYTPNAGPMDAVVKVQLTRASGTSRPRSTSTCSAPGSPRDPRFSDLEFAFDAGGMIRSAMNEGKSTPINIRVTGKNLAQARAIAEAIRREVRPDRRRRRRPDHPAARLSRSTSSTSTAPRPPTSA